MLFGDGGVGVGGGGGGGKVGRWIRLGEDEAKRIGTPFSVVLEQTAGRVVDKEAKRGVGGG